jgi:hypothetical protein
VRLYGIYAPTRTKKMIISRRVKVNEKTTCIIDPLRDLIDTKMTLNYFIGEDSLFKPLNIFPKDFPCKNYLLTYSLSMLSYPSVL